MAYQITFETEDGTVEDYATEARKADAIKIAKLAAKGGTFAEALGITRFFVEKDGQTVATFPLPEAA